MWAYVPMNLLPHLKWLTEADYPHVYYVDGTPKAYDVRIFSSDATHPGGWGTILVVPMRLGGGPMTIDTDGDGAFDRTMRSAIVILDITDPENPPSLIAEITDDTMGFTTSIPGLVKKRFPSTGFDWNTPSSNEWELVIGSGPNVLGPVHSTQNALIYRYNLVTRDWVTGFSASSPHDTGEANSFTGDMAVRNWDSATDITTVDGLGNPVTITGYDDEVVYFGLITGGYDTNPTTEDGGMMRLKMATGTTHMLIDTGQPVVSKPSMSADANGNRWVLFGTGRLYTDNDTLQLHQESFYGVKEPESGGGVFDYTAAVLKSDLFDVTDIRVYTDTSIDDNGTGVLPMGVDTYPELEDEINDNHDGWYRDFTADGTNPSQRNVTDSALVRSALFFNAFTPTPDACDAIGTNHLFVLNYTTGTAFPYNVIGIDTTVTPGKEMAITNIETGPGLHSSVTIHTGSGSDKVTAVSQSSTGALTTEKADLPPPTTTTGRKSWREIWDYD
jgi:type IV pilus assembly protein PilY1